MAPWWWWSKLSGFTGIIINCNVVLKIHAIWAASCPWQANIDEGLTNPFQYRSKCQANFCWFWIISTKKLLVGPANNWQGPARVINVHYWMSCKLNLGAHGSTRSLPDTRERARVPVKKIVLRDSIFDLVNSTYFFQITNHNRQTFNIKY